MVGRSRAVSEEPREQCSERGGLLGGMTKGGFVEEMAFEWALSLPCAGPGSLLFIARGLREPFQRPTGGDRPVYRAGSAT